MSAKPCEPPPPGAFSVPRRNTGAVPVTVFAERSGKRDSVTTLTPGATVDAEFPAGAMAVFRNESSETRATVALIVRDKTKAPGMRYQPARHSTSPGAVGLAPPAIGRAFHLGERVWDEVDPTGRGSNRNAPSPRAW